MLLRCFLFVISAQDPNNLINKPTPKFSSLVSKKVRVRPPGTRNMTAVVASCWQRATARFTADESINQSIEQLSSELFVFSHSGSPAGRSKKFLSSIHKDHSIIGLAPIPLAVAASQLQIRAPWNSHTPFCFPSSFNRLLACSPPPRAPRA